MSYRIMEVIQGARNVVENSVGEGEAVLILGSTDIDPVVYEALAAAAREKNCEVMVMLMTPRTRFGEEPPAPVAAAMLAADVTFQSPSTSIAHALATREAKEAGKRIVSMYFPRGQELGLLQRFADADLDLIGEYNLRLEKLVREAIQTGRECTITSALGTQFKARLRTDIDDYLALYPVRIEGGRWDGPWPPGVFHAYIDEESGNGVWVADLSISGVGGPLRQPVKVTFENGWVTGVEGGEEARRLEATLQSSQEGARLLTPEIGLPSNPRGQHTGFVAEDKRAVGSIHISVGRSTSPLFTTDKGHMFGKNDCNIHMDLVASKSTLRIGEVEIIKDGLPPWMQ